jgi:hypothetical protein
MSLSPDALVCPRPIFDFSQFQGKPAAKGNANFLLARFDFPQNESGFG